MAASSAAGTSVIASTSRTSAWPAASTLPVRLCPALIRSCSIVSPAVPAEPARTRSSPSSSRKPALSTSSSRAASSAMEVSSVRVESITLAGSPRSAAFPDAVELDEVGGARDPHRRAGDDHEHVVGAHGAVAEQRRLDLLHHLVGGFHLADEPRGDAPREGEPPLHGREGREGNDRCGRPLLGDQPRRESGLREGDDGARVQRARGAGGGVRSEEHTSELQSHLNLVCRLLLEKKKEPPDPTLQPRRKIQTSIRH